MNPSSPDAIERLLLVSAVLKRLAETIALPLMEITLLWLVLWATAWLGLEWAKAPRIRNPQSEIRNQEESSSSATNHSHH